jgi:four helix bundle protein
MNLNNQIVIKDFKTLKIWQKASEIEEVIFRLSREFPLEEKFMLTNQIIRSSRSVTANIAEGASVIFNSRQIYHIRLASGSNGETRSHLNSAYKIGYITEEVFIELDEKLIEITKMICGYLKKLQAEPNDD